MKKLFSVLLAVLTTVGLAFAGSQHAEAWSKEEAIATVMAAVKAYNKSHGGTGELFAEVGDTDWWNDVIIVKGEVAGATKALKLQNNGIEVAWRAKLSGNAVGEALIQYESRILVESGAEIRTDGLALEGNDFFITGGTITAANAIRMNGDFLTVSGGDITGDIYVTEAESVGIRGGTINGSVSIYACRSVFSGGIVNAPLIAVRGDEVIIEKGAKVTADDFKLPKGTKLVIDGKLVLPKDFDYSNWEGTVTGKNAGKLAGMYPRWWMHLPNWMQWALRYLCFGWIWMP